MLLVGVEFHAIWSGLFSIIDNVCSQDVVKRFGAISDKVRNFTSKL